MVIELNMEKVESWKKNIQKQLRNIQHRYQKSVRGKIERDGEDGDKNVKDETDTYFGIFPFVIVG
jgi:uncharacterized protein YycO